MKIYVKDYSGSKTTYNLGKKSSKKEFTQKYGREILTIVSQIREAKLPEMILTFNLSKSDPVNAKIVVDVGYCVDKLSGQYKHVYLVYSKTDTAWPQVTSESFQNEVKNKIKKYIREKEEKIDGVREGINLMKDFRDYMDNETGSPKKI